MTDETGHDPAELHHPGDVANEPHGVDDHGVDDQVGDHGHDDHAHGAEAFGPVNWPLWGAFVAGILMGLVPVVGIMLATST